MKFSTLIIAATFTIQFSIVLAGNTRIKSSPVLDFPSSTVIMLAPTAPAEADFSDFITGSDFNLQVLAPVTPSVADFNDISSEIDQTATVSLVPVTPAEADFE